MNKLTTQMKH